MNRDRVLSLVVLLAFLAAQAAATVHRSRHAEEEAAERDAPEHACPHSKSAAHFCAAASWESHQSDCSLCISGAVRSGVPVDQSIAFRNTASTIVPIHDSPVAPKASHLRLPASRAPPA